MTNRIISLFNFELISSTDICIGLVYIQFANLKKNSQTSAIHIYLQSAKS